MDLTPFPRPAYNALMNTNSTITYGETLCGMCDSENTVTRNTGGEFTYTTEVLCEDCGFGTEIHHQPEGTTFRTFQYCR